jgi:signal transduction histidine kinase
MTSPAAKTEPINGARRLLVARRESTFAAQQIELWLGRIFSLALLLSVAETAVNALEQAPLLNPYVFWPSLVAVVGSVIGMVLSHWLFNARNYWYVIHFLAVTATLLTWPIQVLEPEKLPEHYTPWVWWQLGISTLSAGFGLSLGLAAIFVTGVPLYFLFLHLTDVGGSATVLSATQDAVYSFLFSATFIAVVYLLRFRARMQDEANAQAQDQAVEEATQEAIENERLHLAGLLHDQVLNALHTAGTASNQTEQRRAVEYAMSALGQLTNLSEWPAEQESVVSSDSLFSALTKTLEEQAPGFKVASSSTANFDLPIDVASAFTEATMQAVNNSLLHAGGPSVPRKVSLKASPAGLKVVIADEGRGFRLSRIPKNRLGIRTLILRRIESVGGKAFVDSDRGQGARIVLEWSQNG